MDDLEFLEEGPGVDGAGDGPGRNGKYWVLTHNHTVLADGDSARPEGKGVGLRCYRDNLRDGIAAWGKYSGVPWKIDKATEIVEAVSRAEGGKFLECFFSCENDVPGQYLAVVLDNSRHAGRIWLMKTVIHTLTQVADTEPLLLKGKTIFTHHHADFVDKSAPNSAGDVSQPTCKITWIKVPLNGRCECGSPECEYSGV